MRILFVFFLLFSTTILSSTEKLFHWEYQTNQNFELSNKEKFLKKFIEKSAHLSESFVSKLPESMYFFGGRMTSPRSRVFLNHICSLPDARYFEIGSHKGASVVSALYKNPVQYAYCIDNYSEFGDHRKELHKNIRNYIPDSPLTYIDADAFSLNPTSLPKFNIYFYDGGHSTEAQKLAFTHFNSSFDDLFIAIVDDWMWEQVRKGTFEAFLELEYEILYEKEVALRYKDDIPWRFLYVALIRKR